MIGDVPERRPGWNARPSFRWTACCPRLAEQIFAAAPRPIVAGLRGAPGGNFPTLFELLLRLYGDRYDFFYHLERILAAAAEMWLARPAELKALDAAREADSRWFQSQQMLGGVCYVDLFAGNLAGIRAKIPYFKELGLTYLHLMPLFGARAARTTAAMPSAATARSTPRWARMAELSGAGRRAAAERHQPGGRLRLQPHLRRARVGADARWPAIRSTRTTTSCSPTARCPTPTRRTCARSSPTCGAAASPTARRRSTLGLDHLPQLPVGPELRQPGRVPRMAGGDAVPGQRRVWRCCGWTRWPSSGSSWARAARTCPRRTC